MADMDHSSYILDFSLSYIVYRLSTISTISIDYQQSLDYRLSTLADIGDRK